MELEQYLHHLLSQRFKEVWESSGNTCSGTLTAYVVRDFKMRELNLNKRGLFWKVEAALKTLIKDGKVTKVKDNYYPATKTENLVKIGGTRDGNKQS